MSKIYNFIEETDLLRVLPRNGSILTIGQLAIRLGVSNRTVKNKSEPLVEARLVEKVSINKKQFGYKRCSI